MSRLNGGQAGRVTNNGEMIKRLRSKANLAEMNGKLTRS